ncbi:hypothetical protein [Pseudomonas oryzihabitans]|uniref:hypothetical protein n=1 Tax=Pseudomonas oryzihabitans TaxID=47885 RepID=UPI002893DFBD|nr:hypothetical protein [Pseudomonas oryzihabitans]MDT3720364.1 hypothetical protein [Pseudomonas oryzihabitans]
MNAWLTQYRALAWALGGILLLALGALVGAGIAYRLTTGHYRPIVEKQQEAISVAAQVLGSCRTTTSTMEGQIGQQNQALADLRRAADAREAKAQADQQQAAKAAGEDYQAANRLQQERTGGDPAAAAAAIIDKELGL